MLLWDTKGRPAIAVFDPPTRHRISTSRAMSTTLWNGKPPPLLWVVEELIERTPYIGGFSGPQRRVERFICLVSRILHICPSPAVVMSMLRQDVHKYLRVAAMVVIRLIGNEAMLCEARSIGLEDYRKVRVYGDRHHTTSSQESADLFTSLEASAVATSVSSLSQLQQDQLGLMRGVKRSREEIRSDEQKLQRHQEYLASVDLMQLNQSSFFITHVDIIAETLFGKNKNELNGSSAFLGLPLPPLDHLVDPN